MRVIYAGEQLHKSKFNIFLAGPTPREITVQSWRPEFIETLKNKGFQGTVIAPENRVLGSPYDFDSQIPWEVNGLNAATLVVFWIPRKLDTMPAFTTNIEFGEFMHSGKVIVGYPPDSVNNRYVGKRCSMHNIPLFDSIDLMVNHICEQEFYVMNKCQKCHGDGHKDSNGHSYTCSNCDGKGYVGNFQLKK